MEEFLCVNHTHCHFLFSWLILRGTINMEESRPRVVGDETTRLWLWWSRMLQREDVATEKGLDGILWWIGVKSTWLVLSTSVYQWVASICASGLVAVDLTRKYKTINVDDGDVMRAMDSLCQMFPVKKEFWWGSVCM